LHKKKETHTYLLQSNYYEGEFLSLIFFMFYFIQSTQFYSIIIELENKKQKNKKTKKQKSTMDQDQNGSPSNDSKNNADIKLNANDL
jgi:hypothetical protein